VKTLTREEYDFMKERNPEGCDGTCVGHDGNEFTSCGVDLCYQLESRQLMAEYNCPSNAIHSMPTSLGKSAMQCYEFAMHVMNLALS
jgi:hypothetical protein